MTRKSIIEYAVLAAGLTAAYPLIKGDGVLDASFGLWWLAAAPIIPALIILTIDRYRAAAHSSG